MCPLMGKIMFGPWNLWCLTVWVLSGKGKKYCVRTTWQWHLPTKNLFCLISRPTFPPNIGKTHISNLFNDSVNEVKLNGRVGVRMTLPGNFCNIASVSSAAALLWCELVCTAAYCDMLLKLLLHLKHKIVLINRHHPSRKSVNSVQRLRWLMRGFECSIMEHGKVRKCTGFSRIIWLNLWDLWNSIATVTVQKASFFRETRKQERSMDLFKRHKSQALNEAVISSLSPPCHPH